MQIYGGVFLLLLFFLALKQRKHISICIFYSLKLNKIIGKKFFFEMLVKNINYYTLSSFILITLISFLIEYFNLIKVTLKL